MNALPNGWAETNLGNLAEFINGAAFKPEDWHNAGKPIVRIQNLTDEDKPLNLTERAIDDKYHIGDGDILVSWSATLDAFIWRRGPAWLNQHIFKVVPNSDIITKELLFWLLKHEIQNLIKTEHLHGSTMKHINRGPFLAHLVGLPPAQEQKRIVAKLDSVFARTRRAREELTRIPRLIERYKQAVLSAAFRQSDGTSWPMRPLSEIIQEGPTNGFSPKAGDNPDGTLSLKLSATTQGVFVLSENTIKRINHIIPEDSRLWLKPGDLLIQRANSLEYVGTAAIFYGLEKTYIYPDLMMRVRIHDALLRRWVWHYLGSEYARQYFMKNATGTTGNMPKINAAVVRSLMIPIPPERDMVVALEVLEERLSAYRDIASNHQAAHSLLEHLDQATLAKAFRGELVPQDPNDEPASALLERIKAERPTTTATRKRRAVQ